MIHPAPEESVTVENVRLREDNERLRGENRRLRDENALLREEAGLLTEDEVAELEARLGVRIGQRVTLLNGGADLPRLPERIPAAVLNIAPGGRLVRLELRLGDGEERCCIWASVENIRA